MAKNIFDSHEVVELSDVAILELPTLKSMSHSSVHHSSQSESLSNVDGALAMGEESNFPEIDANVADSGSIMSAQEEIEALRANWQNEYANMLTAAKEEAARVVAGANTEAERIRLAAQDEAAAFKSQEDERREAIFAASKEEAGEAIDKARIEAQSIRDKAAEAGRDEGVEKGYKDGYDEVKRLIERLHVIIDRTVEKRSGILKELEVQVVELTLLMTRKVVKVIAENQKGVVVNNVVQALRKLKGRGEITVRVNLADLEIASAHKAKFVEAMESGGKVNLIEDSSVERGGAVIETDFGELDARISSQLNELEEGVRALMPISTRPNDDLVD